MKDEAKKIAQGLIQYLKIVQYLKGREQLDLLPKIVEYLETQALQLQPESVALVTVPNPLSAGEKKLLQSTLESVFGKKLNVQIQVKPEIISGLTIKIADKVIDLSLNKNLEDLAKKFKD